MSTVQNLIDSIRTATDHGGYDQAADQQISDTQLIAFINDAHTDAFREIVDLVPILFAKVAPTFVLAGAAFTQDVTAAPLSLTDFGKVYRLETQNGSVFRAVQVGDPLFPEQVSQPYGPSFLLRGTILEIYPSQQASGTYRLTYLPAPPLLTAAGNTIALPLGCERFLTETVAARVRVRFEEDPGFHLQMAGAEWENYRRYLRRQYGVHSVPGLRRIRGW